MKLYEISTQYKDIQALLEGDDSESMQEAVSETMALIEADFEDKAKSVACLILNTEGDLAAIDAEIVRLQQMKKVRQNRIESIRDYLKHNMQATGISKISCPLFSITLREPSDQVLITDEAAIPDEYVRVKTQVSPDKPAIAKALKEGKEIPGASLVKGSHGLIIK
jgi:uncharacterized secreted protein with C-terminal beta-propeller domain